MTSAIDFAGQATPFGASEKVGPKRHKTKEGFLVCEDAVLARTGFQTYSDYEINDPAITDPPGGVFHVERLEDEVFSPDSIASWQGKPVTNDHPSELVSPETFRKHTVGTVVNPRRGTGEQSNLLLGDLIIKDSSAIALIEAGKTELSGGYNCDYFEVAPGHLHQRNIEGNHVAIVDEGRCGALCSIHDHKPKTVAFQAEAEIRRGLRDRRHTVSKIIDALVKSFKARDDKEFEKACAAVAIVTKDDAEGETAGHVHHSEGSEVHIHMPGSAIEPPKKEDPMDEAPPWFKKFHEGHATDSKGMRDWMGGMDAWRKSVDEFMKGGENDAEPNKEVEGELEEEAPPGTALKDARTAKDSAYLADSFQETRAGAEVLAPGIALPTLDRGAAPAVTFKAICGLRRAALDHAMASQTTKLLVGQVTGGRMIDTKKASCRDVRATFRSVVALKRLENTRASDGGTATKTVAVGGPQSPADLQKINDEFYSKNKRTGTR